LQSLHRTIGSLFAWFCGNGRWGGPLLSIRHTTSPL
jgi:hypothetical protein